MTQRQTMIKNGDRIWQRLVCEDGRCMVCGARTEIAGHHIIKRRHLRTRFNLANGAPLCVGDHEWAESAPQAFLDWLRRHQHGQWLWVMSHMPGRQAATVRDADIADAVSSRCTTCCAPAPSWNTSEARPPRSARIRACSSSSARVRWPASASASPSRSVRSRRAGSSEARAV